MTTNRFTLSQFRAAAQRKGVLAVCFLCMLALGVLASAKQATITVFDAPGAGTGPGQGTFASAINPAGAITGGTTDASNVTHGFLRSPDGTFKRSIPRARTGAGQGTTVSGINPVGSISGLYVDASGVNHGFVRDRDGTFTVIEVAGAGTGAGQGTSPNNINAPGDIAGNSIDANGVDHGFFRTKGGEITTFDVQVPALVAGRAPFLFATTRPTRSPDR